MSVICMIREFYHMGVVWFIDVLCIVLMLVIVVFCFTVFVCVGVSGRSNAAVVVVS